MRRTMLAVLTAVALVLLTAMPSLAASPHFKHGGEPTCTISGSGTSRTVVCSGSITGLGNGDLTIVSTVGGFALYQCQNPGGNLSPGQNRVLEGPQTEPTLIPSGEIKNGNVSFTTNPNTLTADPTVSGAAAGCPNGNWSGVNPTLSITSIVLDISQGGVDLFNCTATNTAGLSGTVALSC
jgi:hypothetical protein